MGDSSASLEKASVHDKSRFRSWMHPKSHILKVWSLACGVMEKWQHLEEMGLSGRKLSHWGRIEETPGLQPLPFPLFVPGHRAGLLHHTLLLYWTIPG